MSYEERLKKYEQGLLEEAEEELEKHSALIESFKKLLLLKGLILKREHFQYIRTIGVIASYPNLVGFLCPELVRDKEGLLNFRTLNTKFERKRFFSGYLASDSYMLMPHPNFRRAYNPKNNFLPGFIDSFWGINDLKIDPYISLDFDRVRIDLNGPMYMEHDMWWGAKFNRNIRKISDDIIKLKPPAYLDDFQVDFIFKSAYSLDIKWSSKDGIKVFQAEEFKTDNINIIKNNTVFFPVRYVHAEVDINNDTVRHFDGAIHYYTKEEYYARRDSDFNYNNKNNSQIKTLSEKLFKLNGEVSIDKWIDLTCLFLSGNPLTFEYFEGGYPMQISETLKAIKLSNSQGNANF